MDTRWRAGATNHYDAARRGATIYSRSLRPDVPGAGQSLCQTGRRSSWRRWPARAVERTVISKDIGLLPGSDAAAAAPLDEPGSAIQPPLPGGEPPSAPAPSADPDVLPSSMGGVPPSSRSAVHASGGALFRLKPTLCLGAIAAACVMTRPAEAALVTALDAHHEQWQHVLDPALRSEPVELLEIGLGRLSMHSELIWLGVLGQWLPVLPSSMGGLNHFIASAGAPSLLVLSLTFFYLVRKLIGSSQLSVSFEGLLQKGKLHTLLTSSFSPVGLAHWAHALAVIILVAPGLEEHYGRKALIGLYAAAGAASASRVRADADALWEARAAAVVGERRVARPSPPPRGDGGAAAAARGRRDDNIEAAARLCSST